MYYYILSMIGIYIANISYYLLVTFQSNVNKTYSV